MTWGLSRQNVQRAGTSDNLAGMLRTAPVIETGLVSLMLAIALGSMVLPVATIGLDYAKSYNEGWNVYHAARVAAGEDLYTGDLRRLVNYPPLSFFLIAGLKPLFGSLLIIGRLLNLAAFAATALPGRAVSIEGRELTTISSP